MVSSLVDRVIICPTSKGFKQNIVDENRRKYTIKTEKVGTTLIPTQNKQEGTYPRGGGRREGKTPVITANPEKVAKGEASYALSWKVKGGDNKKKL